MIIKMLGRGDIFSADFYSSFLINESILVGTPPGTLKKLQELNVDPDSIQLIIVHDLSGFQMFDLPFIIYEAYKRQRKKQLVIVGPEALEKQIKKLLKLAFNTSANKYLASLNICFMNASVIQNNEVAEELYLDAVKLENNEYKNSYGYILRSKDKELGITGEVKMCPGLSYMLKRVNYLIINISNNRFYSHINVKELGEIAKSGEVTFLPINYSENDINDLKKVRKAKILKSDEQFYI